MPDLNPAQFSHGGDAVPGGYNGYVVAHHPSSGEKMGYLDYQTAQRDQGFKIGMVSVDPKFRGQGVANQLLMSARRQIPQGVVDPGFLTEQGHAWWRRSGRAIAKHYKPGPDAWRRDA